MHGAGGLTPEVEDERLSTLVPGPSACRPAPPLPPAGNQRARKHGGYSTLLMPDEQRRYEEIRVSFIQSLGGEKAITDFDQRLIHQAAVACAKFDGAAEAGAPAEIIGQLNRVVLELLRELKATRASREPQAMVVGSPAEYAAMMMKQIRERRPDLLVKPMLIEGEVGEVDGGNADLDAGFSEKRGEGSQE